MQMQSLHKYQDTISIVSLIQEVALYFYNGDNGEVEFYSYNDSIMYIFCKIRVFILRWKENYQKVWQADGTNCLSHPKRVWGNVLLKPFVAAWK